MTEKFEKELENLLNAIPKDRQRFIDVSMSIAAAVQNICHNKNIPYDSVAKAVGMNISVFRDTLAGVNHNLSLRQISKLEIFLGENIIKIL